MLSPPADASKTGDQLGVYYTGSIIGLPLGSIEAACPAAAHLT